MNHSKKNNFPITNIGSVTLMMIFIVLCMVSFAALSLSTAASDSRAAEKAATHVKEYYMASNEAEETLVSIADTLEAAYQSSNSKDIYFEKVRTDYAKEPTTSAKKSSVSSDSFSDLSENPSLTLTESDDNLVISYSVDLNKRQALAVSVLVQYPTRDSSAGSSSGDSLYKIVSWQVISTTGWKGDNSVKLIGE